jgi:hypothetical protein
LAGDIENWSSTRIDRAGQIGRLIDQGIVDKKEMAARLGVSQDSIHAAIRRSDVAEKFRKALAGNGDALPPWPSEPTPCKGAEPELFFPQARTSGGSIFTGNRDQILDALSYCDRCPLSGKRWCEAVMQPHLQPFTGIAAGRVYVRGKARPLPKSWVAAADDVAS